MLHKIKDISETLFRWLSKISQDDYEYMPPGISDWDTKDWQVSKTIIFMHGMGPLWGYHITKGWSSMIMPKDLSEYLEQQFFKNTKRINLIHTSYKEIGQKLDEAKIKHLPFKGIVLAEELYPHIGCRPMADIDIYTGAESAKYIPDIFEKLGYFAPAITDGGNTYYPKGYINSLLDKDHPKTFAELMLCNLDFDGESASMPFSVDVHFRMKSDVHFVSFNLDSFFESARVSDQKGLSAELTLLHLLIHTAKHLIGHRGRWVQLYDVFLLLNSSSINTNEVARITKDIGATHFLLLALVKCREMFSMEISDLERLVEKEVSHRFKYLINKSDLSTFSTCNPSDPLFTTLQWTQSFHTFRLSLRGSLAFNSGPMSNISKSIAPIDPFHKRMMNRIVNIFRNTPRFTWQQLAIHNLSPRKDWK